MTERNKHWIELQDQLEMEGTRRDYMRYCRDSLGKIPTQEELDRFELSPKILAKLAEVDSELPEDKERCGSELAEGMLKLYLRLSCKILEIPSSVWDGQYAVSRQLDADLKGAIMDRVDDDLLSEECMVLIGAYLSDTLSVGQLQKHLAKFGVTYGIWPRADLIALLAVKIIYETVYSPVGEMDNLANLIMNLSHAEIVDVATKNGVDPRGSKATVTVRLVEVIYQDILNPVGT
eukprot:scaffold2069_cov187-Amphora_coffeaeformis.AAC.11